MANDRKLTVTTGDHDYDDIPGTYVFDFDKSHQGFHLNMFCMSLLKPENREAFVADEKASLKRFPMTEAQRQAVLDRDWLGMIQDEYAQMMLNGGRSPDGNRRKTEWDNRCFDDLSADPLRLTKIPHSKYIRETGAEGLKP